jgi:hypothetical protein
MHDKYLDKAILATLNVADQMRVYLVWRRAPVRAKVLQRVTGGTNAATSLARDLTEGRIARCSLGHYYVTRDGLSAFPLMLPWSVFVPKT